MTRKEIELASSDLPNLDEQVFEKPSLEGLLPAQRAAHAPRILLLYGSVRDRSYSRLLTEEAARLLRKMGAETRIFDPRGLPQPDGALTITQRSRNCVSWLCGPRVWSGRLLSVMVR